MIGVCTVTWLFFSKACEDRCIAYEKFENNIDKRVYLHYRITEKYNDTSFEGRGAYEFLMDNGSTYHPFDGLWDKIQVGDSLFKDTGSLKFIIIHKGDTDTDYIYPECGGVRFQ